MKRRFTRWLAAGAAFMLLGAACTFGAEDTGDGGGTAAPDEPVTLRCGRTRARHTTGP